MRLSGRISSLTLSSLTPSFVRLPLRLLVCGACGVLTFALAAPIVTAPLFAATPFAAGSHGAVAAQSDGTRGRKYKAPPETGHIGVEVLQSRTGKPIPNAAVVFHPVKDGKDEGNLEVKTDPDGKASIDVIPVGSTVEVQVIASGFATSAVDFTLTAEPKELEFKMLRPRAQISTYEDNSGEASRLKPGVQEMNKHTTPTRPQAQPTETTPTAVPAPPETQAPTTRPNQ